MTHGSRFMAARSMHSHPATRNAEFGRLADTLPSIVWTACASGEPDYYNRSWYDYTGLTFEQCCLSGWEEVVHPDDLVSAQQAWHQAVETGALFESELRLRRACDGLYRWHLARASPSHHNDETVVTWVGSLTDIEDQRRARQLLQERETDVETAVRQRTADLRTSNLALLDAVQSRRDAAAAREQDLERLNEIIATQSLFVQAELDLGAFLDLTAEKIQRLTDASGAVVEFVDGDEMVYRTAAGSVAPYSGLRLKIQGSLSGLCIVKRTTLVCHDTGNDDRVDADACKKVDAASMIVAPLICDGIAIGALKVVSRHVNAFGRRDVQTLELMAGLLGAALARQRDFDDNKRLLTERTDAIAALKIEMQSRVESEHRVRDSEHRTRLIIDSSHDAFLSIDHRGVIEDWNQQAEKLFGWARDEAIGQEFASLLISERQRDAHRERLRTLARANRAAVRNQFIETRVLHRSGIFLHMELSISFVQRNQTQVANIFARDVTQRRLAEMRLAEREKLLQTITDHTPGMIAYVDANERYRFANPKLLESIGKSYSDILGRTVCDVMGQTLYDEIKPHVGRALAGHVVRYERSVDTPAGASHSLVQYIPDVTAQGAVIGYFALVTDITERRTAEIGLARSEHRLRAVADNMPALIGLVNRQKQLVFLNKHALHWFGKPLDDLIGQHLSAVYSATEYAAIAGYVNAALSGKQVTFEDSTTVNGKTFHYQATYVPDVDEAGAVQGFYAMALDITRRKGSELRQAQSEERLRTITDNLPVLISYINKQQRYEFGNATYESWLGVSASNLVGKTVAQVLGRATYAERRPLLEKALRGESVQFETQTTFRTTGAERHLSTQYVPHIADDGAVLGLYSLTTDISATKAVEVQLNLLARFDPLTRLPNRRHLDDKLAEAMARAKRNQTAFALLYLDVDHFKSINDRYGHAGGDDVLMEIARRLKTGARDTDCVARLAGDEFVVILEGLHSPQDAETVAQKILNKVHMPMTLQGATLVLSVSIGIAYAKESSATAVELAVYADDALYQAKHAGRNRYVLGKQPAQ